MIRLRALLLQISIAFTAVCIQSELIGAISVAASTSNAATSVLFVYDSSATLSCSALSGSIYFYSNGNQMNYDGSKYIFSSSGKSLTITNLMVTDVTRNYTCSNGTNSIAYTNNVAPYLYQVDYNTLTATQGDSLTASCWLLVGTENNQTNITWYWQLNGITILPAVSSNSNGSSSSSISRISISSSNESSNLTISNSQVTDTGLYYCYASNAYGNASRYTKLFIKSNLTPMWPFLGLLAETLIIIAIITMHEMAAKKNPSIKDPKPDDDDDEDDVKDGEHNQNENVLANDENK